MSALERNCLVVASVREGGLDETLGGRSGSPTDNQSLGYFLGDHTGISQFDLGDHDNFVHEIGARAQVSVVHALDSRARQLFSHELRALGGQVDLGVHDHFDHEFGAAAARAQVGREVYVFDVRALGGRGQVDLRVRHHFDHEVDTQASRDLIVLVRVRLVRDERISREQKNSACSRLTLMFAHQSLTVVAARQIMV